MSGTAVTGKNGAHHAHVGPCAALPTVATCAAPPTVALCAALLTVALCAGGATPLSAQDEPVLTAHFEAPTTELEVGTHGTLLLVVDAAPSARQPLLVTPSSDGPAVEVVHGRLFRRDAEDGGTFPLRFRVPILAVSAGDAVVRARIDGYSCDEDRCQPVRAEASVALRVRPAS